MILKSPPRKMRGGEKRNRQVSGDGGWRLSHWRLSQAIRMELRIPPTMLSNCRSRILLRSGGNSD